MQKGLDWFADINGFRFILNSLTELRKILSIGKKWALSFCRACLIWLKEKLNLELSSGKRCKKNEIGCVRLSIIYLLASGSERGELLFLLEISLKLKETSEKEDESISSLNSDRLELIWELESWGMKSFCGFRERL